MGCDPFVPCRSVPDSQDSYHLTSQLFLNKIDLEATGSVKIHLTMYGMNLNTCMEKIEEAHLKNPDMVIVVGAEKVPGEIYGLADFNVSITSQPHSEVAALALFLDRINHGSELEKTFNGKMRIIPSPSGKVVESTE